MPLAGLTCCVVRDIVDPVQDQRLAEFVVGSHSRSHPEAAEEEQQQDASQQQQPDGTIPQDMLRKYIAYAKQQYRPTMSQVGAGSCAWQEGGSCAAANACCPACCLRTVM